MIHHHGAIIPYFVGRIDIGIRYFEKNAGCKYETKIQPPYADHYKKFFIDTATQYYNPSAFNPLRAYIVFSRLADNVSRVPNVRTA